MIFHVGHELWLCANDVGSLRDDMPDGRFRASGKVLAAFNRQRQAIFGSSQLEKRYSEQP
ncbi:hypothetical protein [Acetobacter sp. UBA5411]|uniref:hypothetical protein n=1 Tax=Acetobacter sp. UBA5411 TaxID=1945905 RepID=UPI0025B916CC|nr:hypothetical protein [Acetobacter sp. UBA5411]